MASIAVELILDAEVRMPGDAMCLALAANRLLSGRRKSVDQYRLFPSTDLLNFGKPGEDAVGVGRLTAFKPAFGPRSDTPEGRQVLGKEISPIYFITPKMPPTLIIHGDADQLVPIQQAEIFVTRARDAGATAKLVVKAGAGHGWQDIMPDINKFADWFDKHLRGIKPK